MSKALVIFSGGQDSTTCLGWALNRFEEVECISFLYGQRHSTEVERAKAIIDNINRCLESGPLGPETKCFHIKHKIINIDFFGKMVDSALTGEGDVSDKHKRLKELPASFVPNRNALFITLSHAYAQTINAEHLITGVCQTDFSGYPDCRDDFIKSMQATLNMGYQTNIIIHTPLMFLTKAETFKLAADENILHEVIHGSITCYEGDTDTFNDWGYGCGNCPACKLRKRGYEEYIKKYCEE